MNKAGALHTVTGSTATRRSPRTYTHAVVADYDHASALASSLKFTDWQAKDGWDYYANVAKKNAGDLMPSGNYPYNAADIADARAFIAANPTRAGYIASRIADSTAHITKTPDGTLIVLQWSMSEGSARKAIGTWSKRPGNRNVRVVTVTRKI